MNNVNLGLLKFCLEHTDGTAPAQVPNRDPADYQWLKAAFDNLETDVQKMKKIIDTLVNSSDTTESRISVVLQELQYLVEDIDNATDFFKINGFHPVYTILKNENLTSESRMFAAWVLSTVVQNNDETQSKAMQSDLFEYVIKLLLEKKSQLDEKLAFKLWAIISGLLKFNDSTVKSFIDSNGFEIIRFLLTENNYSEQNKMKVIFSTRYIIHVYPKDSIEKIHQLSLLPILLTFLNSQSLDIREKTLTVLEEYLGHVSSLDEVNQLGVKSRLETIRNQLNQTEDKTKAREELRLVNRCIDLLASPHPSSSTTSSAIVPV